MTYNQAVREAVRLLSEGYEPEIATRHFAEVELPCNGATVRLCRTGETAVFDFDGRRVREPKPIGWRLAAAVMEAVSAHADRHGLNL